MITVTVALAVQSVLFLAYLRLIRRSIPQEARKIMAELDVLKAEIHQITGVKAAIKAAFDGLSAKLSELASRETVAPADIQALADELHSDNADFSALILANTQLDPVQAAATGGSTSSAAPPQTPFPVPAPPVDPSTPAS